MEKSPGAFRTISEVADWLGVQAHVLRFWESKFTQVRPVKRAGGRRYYRPSDMQLLGGIKKLLHDDGMTIKGVQKILREQGVESVSGESRPLDDGPVEDMETSADLPGILQLREHDALAPQPAAPQAPAAVIQPADGATETSAPPPAPEAEIDTGATTTAAVERTDQPAMPAPETTPETPALPSFLHRPDPPETMPLPLPDPVPPIAAAPLPRLVEIADPPPEDQIPYVPGPLGWLVRIERLSSDQATDLTPVAADLKALLERMSAPQQA